MCSDDRIFRGNRPGLRRKDLQTDAGSANPDCSESVRAAPSLVKRGITERRGRGTAYVLKGSNDP